MAINSTMLSTLEEHIWNGGRKIKTHKDNVYRTEPYYAVQFQVIVLAFIIDDLTVLIVE